MNKTLLTLFKVQISNQYRHPSLNIKLLYAFVALIFGGYSFGLAYSLIYLELANLIPAYALTITGIATLFFTIIKTNGILFGYRDYDLLMSLPIPARTVISSRFLLLYFTNMVFTFLIMAPMGLGYAIWEKPSFSFYFYWITGMFAAPLIPTTIAVIIGALIMAFSTRFKYAKLMSTLLSFLLIAAILVLSMMGNFREENANTANLMYMGTYLYDKICSIYPVAGLFSNIFEADGFSAYLLFIGLSLALYELFVILLSIKYKNINTHIKGSITRSDYKLQSLKTTSPLMTLYKKELKRFFNSSIYIINIGTGILMTLLFTVALAVMGPDKLETAIGIPGFTQVLFKILPFFLSTMLAMSNSSCSSLSLEGKNLWVLQSAPLSAKTIFDSKIMVNLTITIPAALVSSLLLTIRLRPAPIDLFLLFAAPLTYSVFTSVWGMFLNIRMPKYDWDSETAVVKQSSASYCGMIGGMLSGLAAIGLLFVPIGIDYHITALAILILLWGIIWILYRTVSQSKI